MKENTSFYLPPQLQQEIEAYRTKKGYEKISQAARALIRIGLKVEGRCLE